MAERKLKSPRGNQSVMIGYTVLLRLASSDGPMYLREIARAVGMPTSKVYRHLASFVELGLVKQVEGNGLYDLGPAAIQLGLAALDRIDEMQIVTEGLISVVESLGFDAHVTVWGDAGATILRWRGRPGDIAIRVTEGRVLPAVSSATGRLWCRHLPAAVTRPYVDRGLTALARERGTSKAEVRAEFQRQLDRIAETGLSFSEEERRRGFDALCGPVFGRDGLLAFTITLLCIHGTADFSPTGKVAAQFRDKLDEIGRHLGHSPLGAAAAG